MILQTNDDFDLEKIAESGQCFRWEKTDDKTYRIPFRSSCLYISSLGEGRFELDCSAKEYEDVWQDYFDLKEDYRHIRKRIDPQEDPFLWKAMEQEKGIRILRQDPWETLISFIISQNKNIPAIRRSVRLLCEACGDQKTDGRGKPYHAFPCAKAVAELSENDLKACRLGYRCAYVRAAAEAVYEGSIDLRKLADLTDADALGKLKELYGVGIKVANCVALFGLHHLNSFPVDVWIRRVLEEEYPEGYPLKEYSPYNGVYQQYMFAYYRKSDA